jgi:DNA-binding response OmpR family regulator
VRDDPPTILLIEDDPVLRTFLADNLSADGYEPVVADTARDGLRALEYKRPDLAIVDVGLPDGSGLEVIERVRAADGVASRLDPSVPLIVLSGRSSELDRVRGLERGADDFVAKPFSYPELRLRLAAVLRRTRERRGRGRLRVGGLELDPASREVRLRGRRVELSQKEFALLRALAADPTRVWTKEELLRDVWGFRALGTTRTLDSHACRLRHKLAAEGDRFVINVWGVGYCLVQGPAVRDNAA